MITQEYLRSILHYDPVTGIWLWRWREGVGRGMNERDAGNAAGTIKDGYLVIMIDGRQLRAHRLAFIYMEGREPIGHVDHHDTNRSNCRWKNLREATVSQNRCNTNKRKDNTSGVKGVSWHSQAQKWRARIQINGRATLIGLFDTIEEADAAYRAKATELFGAFARF